MDALNLTEKTDWSFIESFKKESGVNISLCYQCGNCTAGCPYTQYFDYPVSMIMRLLQTGQKETILNSKAIWLCATCETCTTRCPCEIDVAQVMDVLRHIARRENKVAEKGVKSFYDSFLGSVKLFSRMYEVGMIMIYMLRYGFLLSAAKLGMDIGPKFLTRGKLSFLPYKITGDGEVARIFKKYRKMEKERAKKNV
jgi:heterodisulfide reductase subunit C2